MYSLADAILDENMDAIKQIIAYGADVNEIDEYGFTPLIEAAIVNNKQIAEFLLTQGALPNAQDVTGGTALHWAAENNNLSLTQLLIQQGADPNAYNFAGQPVLVMPTLRRQSALKQLLIKSGADEIFAQDYINAKQLGHMFELVGTATILDPRNQFVEVDFEGFYLEITLGIISESLKQFQNHFAARQMRRFSGIANFIVQALNRASELIRYQQYHVDTNKYRARIDTLLKEEPLIIPVGYEGHAITFIKYHDIWVKCDRREESRLYDNIMFYRITNLSQASTTFLKGLIYQKQNHTYINETIHQLLGLEPITELKVEAQISGNCSWANVEAVIPAIFFLVLMQLNKETDATSYYKTLALNFFHRWRDWNKDRALHFCIQSYERADMIRKASKAEILAAILYQRCDVRNIADRDHIETIISVLRKSRYEYILRNYLKVYYYDAPTEEGKRFAELLKDYGVIN